MKLLAVMLVQLLCLAALAQVPSGVRIQSIKVSGRGCDNQTAQAMIDPDGNSFSVLMDDYKAEATTARTVDLKNCKIELSIAAPAGWSFAIKTADYRGFAQVDAGTQVTHQALYSFDGSSRPPNEHPGFEDSAGRYSFKQQVFNGPFVDNYFIRNQSEPNKTLWSPCNSGGNQPLFIETFLMARTLGRGGSAQITLDTVDGAIQQQFTWQWRQCSMGGGNGGGRPDPGNGRGNPPGRPPRYGGR
jgi:hypothetical protein